MTREEILAVYEQGPDAVCDLVLGVIAKLEARIAELEKRLASNSSNSSRPPSSDGFKRTTSLRVNNSGRKPGGQPGHTGHTLEQVSVPDLVVELPLIVQCPQCAVALDAAPEAGIERRQVFDLPAPRVEVTEYRAVRKRCPGCGGVHSTPFPDVARAPTQYGARFAAVMAHLHGSHLLPCARVAELCGELYGHRPGVAAVLASMTQAAHHMEPTVAAIADALASQELAHVDETGVRCEAKAQWVHVCCNGWLTHLSFGGQRGAVGFGVAGIVPRFAGLLVHDFWAPYLTLDCAHSYCNAHLLRELKAMQELNKHAWAGEISGVLIEMKQAAEQAVSRSETAVPAAVSRRLHERYDRLVGDAQKSHPKNLTRKASQPRGRLKQSTEYSLLSRLDEHRDEVLLFFDQPGVPFDNNQAERDLRMLKVQQKISGCFRTAEGARILCSFRSYISTAKKLGLNLLQAITNAFDGIPFAVPICRPE